MGTTVTVLPFAFGVSLATAIVAYGCSSDTPGLSPSTPDASSSNDATSDSTSAADVLAREDAGALDATDGPTSDGVAPDASPQDVRIVFEPHMGNELWACGHTYAGIGAAPSRVDAQDFRFFVHDVALVASNGNETPIELKQDGVWQHKSVAMLDFENGTGGCTYGTPAVHPILDGKVVPGSYTGIAFTLGVPEALDHNNPATAPSPLNDQTMFWDWNFGYVFFAGVGQSMALAPAPDAGADGGIPMNPFFTHLGSTQCTGAAGDGGTATCVRSNRPRIKLTGFDPATKKIVADWKALVAQTNLDIQTGFGCHSFEGNPACNFLFEHWGINYATGTLIPEVQSVFRVEAQ